MMPDNTAADNQNIIHALLANQIYNLREQMWMSTGKNRHCYNIYVLLQSCLSNLLSIHIIQIESKMY